MGRRRAEPTTQMNVRLPDDLLDEVRRKLQDPVRNKTKHGSITDLISALLYRWINEKAPNPDADNLNSL